MPYASNRGAAPIMRGANIQRNTQESQTSALGDFSNPALGGLLPLIYIAFYFILLCFFFVGAFAPVIYLVRWVRGYYGAPISPRRQLERVGMWSDNKGFDS